MYLAQSQKISWQLVTNQVSRGWEEGDECWRTTIVDRTWELIPEGGVAANLIFWLKHCEATSQQWHKSKSLRTSQLFIQYLPLFPYSRRIVLADYILFPCLNSPPISLYFLVSTNITSIFPQTKREHGLPQASIAWGPTTITFQLSFFLHKCGVHLSYGYQAIATTQIYTSIYVSFQSSLTSPLFFR